MLSTREGVVEPQGAHKEEDNEDLSDLDAKVEEEKRHDDAFIKHHHLEVTGKG